jgi:hypothetical protein
MAPREEAHLRLPGAPVAAILVDEQNRRAAACLFVVEFHAVGCGGVRHGTFLFATLMAARDRLASPPWPSIAPERRIEEPIMREIRYLDKFAKGKAMDKALREE